MLVLEFQFFGKTDVTLSRESHCTRASFTATHLMKKGCSFGSWTHPNATRLQPNQGHGSECANHELVLV